MYKKNIVFDNTNIPIVTDLDNTLLLTDTLWEGLFVNIKKNPFIIFTIIWYIVNKKLLKLKKLISDNSENISLYPLNPSVVKYLLDQKKLGRKIFLATATPYPIALEIAKNINIFSDVYASTENNNLKGIEKAKLLEEKFGKKGFDYIGDSKTDLPVFNSANKAIIYGSKTLFHNVLKINPNTITLNYTIDLTNIFNSILSEIRVKQWIKNILVFVPQVLAHDFSLYSFSLSFLAFLSISFAASFIYIINDVLDLPNDRKHPIKSTRPFASGKLKLQYAPILSTVIISLSFLFATFLPFRFSLYLVLYIIITLIYSFRLKNVVLLDVVVLAALYVLRIIMGGVADDIEISVWVLSFMSFFFLGLAIMKRTSDFKFQKTAKQLAGRPYTSDDVVLLEMIEVCCCFASLIVLCIYIDTATSHSQYAFPGYLWFICPIIFIWYTNLILKAHKGEMHGDPVLFAIHEKSSYITGVLIAFFFIMAL